MHPHSNINDLEMYMVNILVINLMHPHSNINDLEMYMVNILVEYGLEIRANVFF